MDQLSDPYEGKVKLGRMVLDAAAKAPQDDRDEDYRRINEITVAEAFIDALVDSGAMITRIPTREKKS